METRSGETDEITDRILKKLDLRQCRLKNGVSSKQFKDGFASDVADATALRDEVQLRACTGFRMKLVQAFARFLRIPTCITCRYWTPKTSGDK